MGRPGVWLTFAYLLALLGIGAAPRRAGRQRRFSRIGRGAAARRSAPADRPVDELRPHHLGRRRRDLAVDVRARRDVDGVAYAMGAPPQELPLQPSPDVGLAVVGRRLVQLAPRGRRARDSDRDRLFSRSHRRARTCSRSRRRPPTPADRRRRGLRIDRRRRDLRRHADLRRARGRPAGRRRDRALGSAHHLRRDRGARSASGARAVGRRGRDLVDVRPRAVDRRAHRPHHRRGSGRRERDLPAGRSARAPSCSRSAATAA